MTTPPSSGLEDAATAHEPGAPGARGLIVVMSGDVFFGMRIRTSLRPLGYEVVSHGDAVAFSSALSAREPRAVLGLIDFNRPVDWSALADALNGPVPIVAFGPHKDIAGFRSAREAGVTRVVANGEFSRTLPELVERYANSPSA